MRSTLFLLGALAALATAQTTTPATATNTAANAANSEQAAILACLDACTAGDVSCTAKCISVPNPNTSDVDATNKCVAACPKGSGTATDNLNYQNCVDGCIGKYYYTTAGAPQGTAAAGSPNTDNVAPSGSGSGSGGASPTGTNGGAATGTGGAAATTSSSAAGASVGLGSAATVGFLGFLIGVLAM
ncbi:hypothetical protein B0H67DRAFT_640082 [Lasiosphaeris hirsuta]|uniref:Uncharacterized protein n=1 Tax=Lasiosphaeris hirsuta TaxID=260670 RepID=A0AA40BCI1_9PEZI|nr:hypothetical protein B0H67DRAFT_640082 [Lasiosphaeris hirsuta]